MIPAFITFESEAALSQLQHRQISNQTEKRELPLFLSLEYPYIILSSKSKYHLRTILA